MRRIPAPESRTMNLRHVLAAARARRCWRRRAPRAPSAPYVVAALEPTRGNTAAGTVGSRSRAARSGCAAASPAQAGPGARLPRPREGRLLERRRHERGGHLNPDGKPHGPPSAAHHAGDLPALKADASGTARVERARRRHGARHRRRRRRRQGADRPCRPDDYTTQPTGNSGARIACGVISTTPGRDAAGREMPLPGEM